jgi:ribosomal protein S18 acetylase RimI-like enzyme
MSDATALVTEVDSTIAGFIIYEVNHGDLKGESNLLAVHPAFQNRGIGAELNRAIIERMRAAGTHIVMVETGRNPGYTPARRTY